MSPSSFRRRSSTTTPSSKKRAAATSTSSTVPRCSRAWASGSTRSRWRARMARPPRPPCSRARSTAWASTRRSSSAASSAPTGPTRIPARESTTWSKPTSPTSRSRFSLPRASSSPILRPTILTTTRTSARSSRSSSSSWLPSPRTAPSSCAARRKRSSARRARCTPARSRMVWGRNATRASCLTARMAWVLPSRSSFPTVRRSKARSSRIPVCTTCSMPRRCSRSSGRSGSTCRRRPACSPISRASAVASTWWGRRRASRW